MNTSNAFITHIGIFGEVNAGKSSFFNKLLGQDVSITSKIEGTTTDAVKRRMELISFGPIVLIDTAGLNDNSELGEKRVKNTKKVIDQIDVAILVIEAENANNENEDLNNLVAELNKKNVPLITVISKTDLCKDEVVGDYILFDNNKTTQEMLAQQLLEKLNSIDFVPQKTFVAHLLPKDAVVILVIPIDDEAPAGRIILPQVQILRECLDFDIRALVTTPATLQQAINDLSKVDLVITDSQAFDEVSKITPKDIMLTSFSILFANQKGDFATFYKGLEAIENLQENDKILIAECCSHNVNHDDIGTIKIPKLLQAKINKKLDFTVVNGKDYPANLDEFKLIIHCGGCMLTPKQVKNRIINANDTPISNYGLILAYLTGILERSIEILNK